MTLRSRHILGWLVPRRGGDAKPWKRFAVSTAITATLSYLTVVVGCACTDREYWRPSAVESLAVLTLASEAPVPDTDEELCKFMHEPMLTLPASSAGSILIAKSSYLDVLIGEELPSQTPLSIAFRPPGKRFAPAKIVVFPLYSVLRI